MLDELVGKAELAGEARRRVVEAAAGNPLFLEQLVAMLAEEQHVPDETGLPHSIRAVLAARLDRLGPAERAVLERASVAGREVPREVVAALLPEEAHPSLDRHLRALVRKGYLRADGDAFRFHHALVQEAAYRAVSKQQRAELHARLADWLEEAGVSGELIGYHLERGFRCRVELQDVDWHARQLARRGAEHLGAAGRRALAAGDPRSAVDLLERADSLLRGDDPTRLDLLPDLIEALREASDFDRAAEIADAAVDDAAAAGDRRLEALTRIERAYVRLATGHDDAVGEALEEGKRAVAVLEDVADEAGAAKAWRLVAVGLRFQGRQAARRDALERALAHVRRTGDRRTEAWVLDGLGGVHNYGPTPVAELIRFAEGTLEWARANDQRFSEAHSLAQGLGRPYAMLGEFDGARRLVAEAREIVENLGFVWHRAGVASAAGFVEMLGGDFSAAERELRAGYELVEEAGMTGSYFGMALRDELADALCAQARYDEAARLSEASERGAAPDDVQSQVLWRSVRAKAFAGQGRLDEAEHLARDAVAIADETELVIVRANALAALAEVLSLAGRREAASAALRAARRLYRAKGDRVSASRPAAATTAAPAVDV